MKKILAILSLFCFIAISVSSYASGDKKDSKPACCQKGGDGKACCKDHKSCDKDAKAAKVSNTDAKPIAPVTKEEKKATK
jgi:hypothetical protein